MSGIKISALPVADEPLTGAELVPVVQDGITKQTTVTAFLESAGVATAALAAGQTDNLLVATIADISRLALTLAGDATLTGIQGGTDGKRLMLVNRSAFTLTLPANFGSVANNQFASNGDLIVPSLCGAEYLYDGTNQRWVKT